MIFILYYTFIHCSLTPSVILQEAYECLRRDIKEIKAKATSEDLRRKMKGLAENLTRAATYFCQMIQAIVLSHLVYTI